MNIELRDRIKQIFNRQRWQEEELKREFNFLRLHPDFSNTLHEVIRERDETTKELMQMIGRLAPKLNQLYQPTTPKFPPIDLYVEIPYITITRKGETK